jgi:hypothetical protein
MEARTLAYVDNVPAAKNGNAGRSEYQPFSMGGHPEQGFQQSAAVTYQQTPAAYQYSAATYQQRAASFQQQPAPCQQPQPEYQQPVKTYHQPKGSYQQPTKAYHQQTADYQQPLHQKPAITYQQPPQLAYQQQPTQLAYQQQTTPYQQPGLVYRRISDPPGGSDWTTGQPGAAAGGRPGLHAANNSGSRRNSNVSVT